MRKLDGVIDAQQFDPETLDSVFAIADEMKINPDPELLKGKIMATLFYESSTRTRLSFESAMKKLGGEVIGTENAKEFSSAAKGESLEDTIRVVSGYADVIVLRYHQEGGAQRAQKISAVPVINAGDGAGQHPTQALLDLYSIWKKFGKLKGLKIVFAGDLANSRTVRSLCYLLAKHYPENEIYFISPAQVKMRGDIKEFLDNNSVRWSEAGEFNDALLSQADVVYQTRVQKERFEDKPDIYKEVLRASEKIIINKDILEKLNQDSIILHPLPRITEITPDVDADPRAYYFQQAQNGLYIRMALLKMILIGY